MNMKCKICSKIFKTKPAEVKRGGGIFCSRKCYTISLKGKPSGMLGKFHNLKTLKLMKEKKMGILNPNWKGNKVTYGALHDYIKFHLQKPNRCNDCKKIKKLDLANISGKYSRNLSDWEWVCRRCHMKKDGRLLKLQQYNGR